MKQNIFELKQELAELKENKTLLENQLNEVCGSEESEASSSEFLDDSSDSEVEYCIMFAKATSSRYRR